MAVNGLGATQVYDWGNPRIITGEAMETISGGELVFTSGVTGVVGSGLDTFTASDVKIATGAADTQFMGVALQTVTSGNILPVAVDGVFLLECIGSTSASHTVETPGTHNVQDTSGTTAAAHTIGRAVTAGASGGFAAIQIK